MAQFTFLEVIAKLAEMPEAIESELVKALTKCGVQVQKTMVSKFGTYQPDIGPYNAWAVLSPDYLNRKMAAGAAGDDPLIGHYTKSGGNKIYPVPLRNSITMHVDAHKLATYIGTNDPLGEWHEFGTTRIPPRPFARPSLYQNQAFIQKTIREALALGLVHL